MDCYGIRGLSLDYSSSGYAQSVHPRIENLALELAPCGAFFRGSQDSGGHVLV